MKSRVIVIAIARVCVCVLRSGVHRSYNETGVVCGG